jgi:hypothetical protein
MLTTFPAYVHQLPTIWGTIWQKLEEQTYAGKLDKVSRPT